MRRSQAKAASEAAADWQRRGMFKDGAFDAIQKELAPDLEGSSLATQALYAIGGILLGAATAALYALMDLNGLISDDEGIAWIFFTICGLLLGLAAAAIHVARQEELGDALIIAALVPWAITLGPEAYDELLHLVPALVGAAVMVLRREARLVPFLGHGLILASVLSFLFHALDQDAFVPWAIFALLAYAGTTLWMRFDERPWRLEAEVTTSGFLAVSIITVIAEEIRPRFDAGEEVLFGIALLALIGVGVLLQQRGTVGVAASALTIDAIVFAFDVGGPTVGLLVLVGLSACVIVLATYLRRNRSNRLRDGRL